MAEELFLEDAYLREFEATVTEAAGDGSVSLDRTAFYPSGGGQPHDTGRLSCADGREVRVVEVSRRGAEVVHRVEPGGLLRAADRVRGAIDWERRYAHMRHHTAAHVLSAVVHRRCGALITGNQLAADGARFDFDLASFDREAIGSCVEEANRLASGHRPVRAYRLGREEVERRGLTKLAKGLPEGLEVLRIVEIDGVDVQADGGTHVRDTAEIGRIEVVRCENKGKGNRRVYFRLA